MVVPMNCDEVGSKIGSAAFRMRLKREAETWVSVEVFFDLAIAKPGIVTPVSIEKFISFEAQRGKERIGLVIDDAIAELDEARQRTPGDDLLKWVEGIECAHAERRCLHRSGRRGLARAACGGIASVILPGV